MQDIKIGRYAHPKATGWAGWLEPADKSWIVFVGLDGRPRFFLHRDPETGAILPDDPDEREAFMRETHGLLGALRTGMANDGSADHAPNRDPLLMGERVFPLGESGSGVDIEPLK